MASKLPRVVPIRVRSGLVHDLGTQVSILPAISDAILWKAGAADCEMWDGHCHSF
ncbi:hypothetical protein TIFTF001_044198 [Ficus carica]|uniref:Uncharacterized protein n=1 Tax=Ficus carica TaxID=3494 RepID=A0AA87ZJD8_FICCA|nr:hypothetical protein TIFTF001_044198 [Ficus carica]